MNKVSNIVDTNYDPQAIPLLQSPVAIHFPSPTHPNNTDYDSDSYLNDNSDSEDKIMTHKKLLLNWQ